MSFLPNNNKSFCALELFQRANVRNSDVQKFLISTNIGHRTLTLFLSSSDVQKLFSVTLDHQLVHCVVGEIDPKLEVNQDLWTIEVTQNLIIETLLLLNQLANSANISKEVKTIFSGILGNAGLLIPAIKRRVVDVFSITSDGLLKLQDLLKSLNRAALKLESLSLDKKGKLRTLHTTCDDIISEAIKNYKKVIEAINQAPAPEKLALEFKASMLNLEAGITTFRTLMVPLLPLDRQARYTIEDDHSEALEIESPIADNTASASRTSVRNNSSSLLALTAGAGPSSYLERDERSVQIEEIEEAVDETGERRPREESSRVQPSVPRASTLPQRREVDNYRPDYMAQIARTYLEANHRKLVANATFIETRKAKIITAFKNQKNDNIVAVSDNANQVLERYIDDKNTARNLKAIGAIGGAIMAPAVVGIGVGVALHYTTWVALSGVTAVAPFGAMTAATVGGATLIIAGGIAAYRVRHMSVEERRGRGTFSLWISEVGNCFTFNNEYMRNQNIYHRLSNWSGCLYGCVKDLADVRGKDNIDFTLKVLEAVLYYLPSQDKALLEEYHPEGSKRQGILNQAIKLRYAFLKLIQENKVCFIEEVIIEASATQMKEKISVDSSFELEEKDTKTIEAAKTAFICLIYGTMEHLQMKKEELLKREAPRTSLMVPATEEVINNECIGRN